MARFAQVGIAIGALGVVIALMGLFPGVTGIAPTTGIGIVQVFMLLVGFSLLIFGALVYVKYTFYLTRHSNLAQQIGIRLALTGLVFAALTGLADILGFGSHERSLDSDILFGPLQAAGLLGTLALSSIGVLIYAITGNFDPIETPPTEGNAQDNNPDSPQHGSAKL